jgi:hypothetical protein
MWSIYNREKKGTEIIVSMPYRPGYLSEISNLDFQFESFWPLNLPQFQVFDNWPAGHYGQKMEGK